MREAFRKGILMDNRAISVKTYSPADKTLWDNYVDASKNGVFLFKRDYMDYHSDRFRDHSLIFLRNNEIVGLLPANIKDNVLYSHEGLTFGGVLCGYEAKMSTILDTFNALIGYCEKNNISKLVYKAIPYIYHSTPASEDLYALFRNNAKLTARNASSCICLPQTTKPKKSCKDNLRKAQKNGLVVRRSFDFEEFMVILQETLRKRHNVKPVHSLDEITLLAKRFPENIKLYGSFKDNQMLAGVIIYESKNVAHEQYAANSKEGFALGAQDIIELTLIHAYCNKKYYDFGISTEKAGQVLNYGLIGHKEGFGASTVMYDIYQINL